MGVTAGPDPVPDEVLRWAQRPGAATLLRAVRAKVEAGKITDGVRVAVSDEHRDDVGRILGVSWELSEQGVTLRVLRNALARAGTDLEALLTAVGGGPLRDRSAERRHVSDRNEETRAGIVEALVGAGVSALVADVAVRRRWLAPNLDSAVVVAEQVARAWKALPRAPDGGSGVSVKVRGLAEFAGQVLLDPHALDRVRPAGKALARLAAASFAAHDAPESVAPVDEVVAAARDITRASRWRAVWARVGITCDQVSSTVLLLNLPLSGGNPALAIVTGTPGEPVWVTGRMTADGCEMVAPSGLGRAPVVLVCENPSVAEAAGDALGRVCPPLVCLYGRPSGSAWAVLDAAAAAGARILVSTDRDVAGEQIAAEVTLVLDSAFGAGTVAPWLPEAEGVFEEERLAALLEDLSSRSNQDAFGASA